ncbi:hypothetical protein TIFTF001_045530 [Ficus carica]|uniref:Uncharacterized protein n=1 Tax=Ficus carica TaxID=3494 RepID=A0AA88CY12_FICCA|nr:hypothetical protein TIFTF001_045530 [Ficus carica]
MGMAGATSARPVARPMPSWAWAGHLERAQWLGLWRHGRGPAPRPRPSWVRIEPHDCPVAQPGQLWAWPRRPARPVARPVQLLAWPWPPERAQWLGLGRHGRGPVPLARPSWARPGPHDCPVARPGQSWAWPRPPARPVPRTRPRLAWPRPQAHARALAETPCTHMGVAGQVSDCMAAHGVAEMTFFTIYF